MAELPMIDLGTILDNDDNPIDWELKCSFGSIMGYDISYHVRWMVDGVSAHEEQLESNSTDEAQDIVSTISSDMFVNIVNINEVNIIYIIKRVD